MKWASLRLGHSIGLHHMVEHPRMNWDRVHKEDLARKRGSEWAEKEKTNSRAAAVKSRPKPGRQEPVIKGCTCGKRIGFIGEHKRTCPLRISRLGNIAVKAGSRKDFSLSEFASTIKRAGHGELVRQLFGLELELLKRDATLSHRQRDETITAVRALLEEL
jgi:hypothetical protein